MKNKKIIAFVCAISMIFSLFSAFSVVNAADKGIVLEVSQKTATEAVVTAKYVGFDDGVIAGNVVFTYPTGATVALETDNFGVGDNYTAADGKVIYPFAKSSNTKTEGDVIASFKVTLAEALTKNFTCKLIEPSKINAILDEAAGTKESYSVEDGSLSATAIIAADPNKTPENPLPKPPVVDPSANPLPEAKDPVTVGKGIELTAEKAADGKSILVTAKYVGFADGVIAGNVVFTYPTGATVALETDNFGVGDNYTAADGKVIYPFAKSSNTKTEGDVIASFNVTFENAITDDIVFELIEPSKINAILDEAAGTKETLAIDNETLPAAWVKVEAGESMDAEIPLIQDENGNGLVKDPGTLSENAYAALEVKKANGEPAKYDEDYVAYYKGEKLTKEQLDNLLAGAYLEEGQSLVDMLKDVVLKYNSGITGKLQIIDVDEDGNPEVITSGETPDTSTEDNTSDGSLSLRNKENNIDTGENVSLKFSIKPATNKKGEELHGGDEALTINVKEVSYNVLSATGITVESKDSEGTAVRDRVTINDAETDKALTITPNEYTIKFTPVLKTPDKEPIEFTVTYIDANGKESTATLKYNVRERSTSSGSSSSSGGSGKDSNGSSSDVLANGNTGSLNGLLGGFTDMAGYDWAQTAVTALAMRNIVSGRGDGTFDPGGQITRAEYAQMLINAIGKSSDYADTTFNDVPTDAWFYHNVAVAAQLGIVSGYGDGNFGPYDLITREQMALMTQKAAIVMNKSLTGAAVAAFSDDAEIADWAKAAVYDLANVGIINGMGDGTFAPKANATRAQAAVIIYGAFVK